jgi:hypothetical protein
MLLRSTLAMTLGLALVTATAPTAHAQPEMPSTWHSNSLRDNDIGYHFDLTPVAGSPDRYTGVFRFTHRDDRRVAPVPITLTRNGRQVTLRATKGSFDRSAGPLRGRLSADGTKLRLTNCQARLRLVMSFALDSDCVFRPASDTSR